MSGTVPPPPPPGPGPQESGGASSPAPVPRRDSAAPPSFAPRRAAATETAVPDEQATRQHAPVPPAPAAGSPAPPAGSPAPPPAQTAAWNATAPVPGQGAAPPQQYGYTPQQYAYQQPAGAGGAGTPPGTTQQPAVGGGRRRLSAGWIAFIALDVVLLVVAIAFAFGALGGSDLPDTQAGGATEAAAGQDPQDGQDGDAQGDAGQDADSGPGELVTEFASPSRNITCEVYADQVTCGLADLNQQPAPVEGCDGISGYAVTLTGGGDVELPCLSKGDKPKKAPKDMEQLPYGESRTEGDFTCTSETDGMYCQHDPSGSGFSLARAGVGTY